MRRTGSMQHYFTVRGRGFDLKQWSRVLAVVKQIVDRAKKAGLKATFTGSAWNLVVGAPGADDLQIIRKGEPGIPKEVTTEGKFDVVVQTVLTAVKKIAPDIFVMTSPDGRDYRRLFAQGPSAAPGQGSWSRMKRLDQAPKTKEEAFLRAMSKQKWRHPETGNQVEFVSLPKKEQSKLRTRWEQEFGDKYQRALDDAKKESEEAHRELEDADKAVTKVDREKEKAEKAEGLDDAYEKTLEKMAQMPREGKEAKTMNEETIRRAAIRVAAKTADPELKRELLTILRGTAKTGKDDGEKEGRHDEGKSIDVGTWLKNNGYADAASKWEKHEGDVGKKASVEVFPDVHKTAWKHVLVFARKNPESKVASGSTADRVAAAAKLADKWLVSATERVGEHASASLGELDAAIAKAASPQEISLLQFAKALRSFKPAKKVATGDDVWLNEESFAKAATEVWGAEHLAKEWISDAIKRPGRVRKYLGIPEGEDIPASKLDKAIENVKGQGNKSLLSALLLAKRLKKMHKKNAEQAAA